MNILHAVGATAEACLSGLSTRIEVDRESEGTIVDAETEGATDEKGILRQVVPIVTHGKVIEGRVVLTAPPGYKRAFGGLTLTFHCARVTKGPPGTCLLYTSPSPRDKRQSRMPSSA